MSVIFGNTGRMKRHVGVAVPVVDVAVVVVPPVAEQLVIV
jgi:hypothetical protein